MFIVSKVMDGLSQLDTGSVHCIVTSPPYWGLRDYGVKDQWGIEADMADYLYKMHWLAGALRRVLRPDGTCWVNIGDKYLKKNLLGLPWKVAFTFQKQGWYLRSAIVWQKPNCIPHSVKDRPTSSYEMLFLFTQLPRYYYDHFAIREPSKEESIKRMGRKHTKRKRREPSGMDAQNLKPEQMCHPAGRNARDVWTIPVVNTSHGHFSAFPEELVRRCIMAGTSDYGCCGVCGDQYQRDIEYDDPEGRLGKAWHSHTNDWVRGQRGTPTSKGRPIPKTKGWLKICECHGKEIVSSTVLDPFMGSGTTAVVAEKLGRKWIGIDIDPENKKRTEMRLQGVRKELCNE